jgi:ubiquinone/menaquinone biosynthesis C-methylase UbiE
MPAAHAFWDKLAERYAAQPIANETAYQTKLAETRRRLRPDMEVLEFGCGTGSTALAHAPHAAHIRAIDFSQKMIDIATAKAAAAGIGNVSFERGAIESMDLAPESLDMVLGLSILHLLRDKATVIARVFGALRPGGYFITSTICIAEATPLLGLLTPLTNRLGQGLIPYLDVMDSAQLVAALTHAGFHVEHRWQPDRKSALFLVARKPEA